MWHAIAAEIKPIGIGIGQRITVGGIEHHEHPLPRLERLAVQLLRMLDDAHLRARRTVVAQQLFHGRGGQSGVGAQALHLIGKAHQRQHAVGNVVGGRLVAGKQHQDACGDQLVFSERIVAIAQ